MTTEEYNADNPFAVAVGLAKGRGKACQTPYSCQSNQCDVSLQFS